MNTATAENLSIPSLNPPPLVGSHRVDDAGGGKVLVRSVEIFGVLETGPLGKVDERKLQRILHASNEKIGQKCCPQVVLSHEPKARVVGRIPRPMWIALSPETGEQTIYADVEMAWPNFLAYVASNEFPRRSAEIDRESLAIENVALLGRDAPAVTMPDLVFSRDAAHRPIDTGAGAGYQTRVTQFSFATYIPGDQVMGLKEIMASLEDLNDEERDQVMAKCKKPGKSAKHADDEEPEDKDKDKKAEHGAPAAPATASKDPDVLSLHSRLAQAEGRATVAEQRMASMAETMVDLQYRTPLQAMKDAGFRTIDVENEVKFMKGLPDDAARAAHLEKIRTNYRCTPTGSGLVAGGALGAHAMHAAEPTQAAPAHFTSADRDKVVAHCQKNSVTFDQAMRDLGYTGTNTSAATSARQ